MAARWPFNPTKQGQGLLHAVVYIDKRRCVKDTDEGLETGVEGTGRLQVATLNSLEELAVRVGGYAAHTGDGVIRAEDVARKEVRCFGL